MRLDGKVAIVTGGAGGIGRAIGLRLLDEGAIVVVADLDGSAAVRTASALSGDGSRVLGLACDVASEDQVRACASEAVRRFGRLDVVVNNAGLMTFKALDAWTADEWIEVLRVDLVGAAMFTARAFDHFGPEGGAIVNVASIHAVQTSALAAPYGAAKAALLSLTRSTAIEGRPRRIRANAVLPGAVDTPMLWDNPNIKSGAERIDPADVGKPADVAAAVAFLASEDAGFITGTALTVDGGRLAEL